MPYQERRPQPGVEPFTQPYIVRSEQVEITPQERAMGSRTLEVFEQSVKRRLPWMIESNGTVSLLKTSRNGSIGVDGSIAPSVREEGFIDLSKLESEQISPVLAGAIDVFKGVEDYLPDFTKNILTDFRNYQGFTYAAYQWGVEESQHGRALGEILVRTGSKTKGEVDEDYFRRLGKTWEPPFPTEIEMLGYSVIQEPMTSINYVGLAKRAKDEGAPVTAELLLLMARDESWHGQGYRRFYEEFARLYPDEAKKAILNVGSHFSMPAHNLMENRRRDLIISARAGATTGDQFHHTVYKTLNGFDFITPEEAMKAADDCMDNLKI